MKEGCRPRIFIDARKAGDFGIGRYIAGLLEALSAAGEVDLTALVREEMAGSLPPGVLPIVSAAGHYSARELLSVRGAFARSGAAVFHAPHYVVPLLPAPRTVVTIHDLMHLTRPEHASVSKRIYAATMLRRAVRSAARVICVSEAVARELSGWIPSAREKTTVIPNGVDARFLAPVPARDLDAFRKGRGLAFPWIVFLGNDKPHKNLSGLLQAYALFRSEGAAEPRIRLVLAGGAPERRDERARAASALGIGGDVVDLGVVPDADLPPLIAGAEALVLPSFDEGFGLPVLEAQALGTPVVCSSRGGLPEAAGDAALLVDPESPEDIASALARVVGDRELRNGLRERGRARARRLTWSAAAERTAAVYREVLSERP